MPNAVDERERGLEAYARREWQTAHRALSAADRAAPLGAEDLERLATAAYMVGRDEDYLHGLERAHQAYLDAGEPLHAVRCAFWVGVNLALRGSTARATGWLGRAQRLVERERRDCVEQGFVLLATAMQQEDDAAYASLARAVEIGERFGDADLVALGLQDQGRMLLRRGEVEGGLALLDEAMVAVAAGEVSPIVTGLLYCSVIDGCHEVYALSRAQEWTTALTQWCAEQPDMVAFTGRCLMHRAELMQVHGAWPDALDEARRAAGRAGMAAVGQARYRQGEIHRLRGEFAPAEEAYREASLNGWEPQPGLALLRLAQGSEEVAAAAIRRAAAEATDAVERAGLLPAYVEIMLATGDVPAARAACGELAELAKDFRSGMLDATVAYAEGAVALAEDDPRAALVALRRAGQAWQELDARYEAARVRVLVGLACRALGDEDSAALELDAARVAFAQLGAAPELARLDRLTRADPHGLTPRELQVLRLVAAGHTNKAIAAELVLSERTVDRHVSNTFAKLRVSSRAAATAYAYEHRLV